MFHVKHFLAVISLLVMKCKLRYAIESIYYYRYQGESLIYISFPIGICFKRVPVHSYPFPYLNPLPTAVRESVRLSAFVSRETFCNKIMKKSFKTHRFVIQ